MRLLNHWFNCIKIVGQIDTFLSEEGIEQAQLVGTKLQDEQFSHIFSSDLSRARNVSFISYKLCGCTAKQLEKKLEIKKVLRHCYIPQFTCTNDPLSLNVYTLFYLLFFHTPFQFGVTCNCQ